MANAGRLEMDSQRITLTRGRMPEVLNVTVEADRELRVNATSFDVRRSNKARRSIRHGPPGQWENSQPDSNCTFSDLHLPLIFRNAVATAVRTVPIVVDSAMPGNPRSIVIKMTSGAVGLVYRCLPSDKI